MTANGLQTAGLPVRRPPKSILTDRLAPMPTSAAALPVRSAPTPGTDAEHPKTVPLLAVRGQACILNPRDIATIGVDRQREAAGCFLPTMMKRSAASRSHIEGRPDGSTKPLPWPEGGLRPVPMASALSWP